MKEILLNTVYKTKNYKKHTAIISDDDFAIVATHNWNVCKFKDILYACTRVDGKNIMMHNLIMGFNGIDHKDGNGLNNQRENLREATQRQNCMNRKKRCDTVSAYKGVTRSNKTKWRAQITVNGKLMSLGCYHTEEEAASAYNLKARQCFGEFAKLNTIQ